MKKDIKWTIDSTHSEIEFKIRHLMIAHVKGSFKVFDANIYTTSNDFTTAQIDLWIDASSISTGDTKRDEHLKSEDFFDVENHKQISFTASTIGGMDETGFHQLWGELTMKGVTKNLMLTVQFGGLLKDPWGKERAGFTVSGKLNRSDWGLVWNSPIENGGLMVSDEVNISCEIQLTRVNEKDVTIQLETEEKLV
jgi:polyisoprenoid-binding protein YceI